MLLEIYPWENTCSYFFDGHNTLIDSSLSFSTNTSKVWRTTIKVRSCWTRGCCVEQSLHNFRQSNAIFLLYKENSIVYQCYLQIWCKSSHVIWVSTLALLVLLKALMEISMGSDGVFLFFVDDGGWVYEVGSFGFKTSKDESIFLACTSSSPSKTSTIRLHPSPPTSLHSIFFTDEPWSIPFDV